MNISDLCKIFGFVDYKCHLFDHDSKNYTELMDFANEHYQGGKSKPARITHPAIHYAYRLISNTLFNRTDTSNVVIDEFCMLHGPFSSIPRK